MHVGRGVPLGVTVDIYNAPPVTAYIALYWFPMMIQSCLVEKQAKFARGTTLGMMIMPESCLQ